MSGGTYAVSGFSAKMIFTEGDFERCHVGNRTIRDHVRLDVLTKKAAELQRVDAELAEVERTLRGDDGPPAGSCPSCGAARGADARFCSTCGFALPTPEAAS